MAVGLQTATALLDIVGVLLTGLVGAVTVSAIQSTAPPPQIMSLANSFGLGDLSTTSLVVVLAGAAAVILLGKTIVSGLLTRRILVFLANRQAMVSARLTQALLSQPITFLHRRSSQESSYALIQGAAAATMQVLGQTSVAISEIALLVLMAATLFALDPWITIGCVLFFGLLAWLLQRALGSWAYKVGMQQGLADIASLNTIQSALATYREISVLGRRPQFVHEIQEQRWRAARVAADSQLIGLIPKYLLESALVVGGFILAGFLFGTRDAVQAVGTLALFIAAASRVMPSLLRLQTATLALRGIAGAAAPTFSLADELGNPLELPEAPLSSDVVRDMVGSAREDFVPRVIVDGVTFTYPGATVPAISEASLTVPAGSSVALVGRSGAGKTTLADLMIGVLPPERGKVEIGGCTPSGAFTRWPGGIAYVPQQVVLLNGSIRSNVALGIPADAIDDELVWSALERAQLRGMLAERPLGLDTEVGEHGVKLSGGQRQRLGIARALYSRPRLIVLDEATSSLDVETEHLISSVIASMQGDVTLIIVAHRLSTVLEADQVVYLDGGRIRAVGSFGHVRDSVPDFDRQARLLGL